MPTHATRNANECPGDTFKAEAQGAVVHWLRQMKCTTNVWGTAGVRCKTLEHARKGERTCNDEAGGQHSHTVGTGRLAVVVADGKQPTDVVHRVEALQRLPRKGLVGVRRGCTGHVLGLRVVVQSTVIIAMQRVMTCSQCA